MTHDDTSAALRMSLKYRKRIEELEALRKKELDFYLWDKKQSARRIALLTFWMEKLFFYVKSPHAKRNEIAMTTEVGDWLIREGMDYLNRDTSALEQGDGNI
jgi:hypothetical protein